jgi:hypothetical protein
MVVWLDDSSVAFPDLREIACQPHLRGVVLILARNRKSDPVATTGDIVCSMQSLFVRRSRDSSAAILLDV